jgi:hypothetical protein
MSRRIRSQTEPLPGKPSLRSRGKLTEQRPFNTRESYAVGYRKPPKATQFRKGESGYKNGRKKGSRNVATLFAEALSEHVTVMENGSPRRISKLEVMFKQLVDQGAAATSARSA